MNESNLDAHVSIVARVGGGRTDGEMMDHGSDFIALASREVEEGATLLWNVLLSNSSSLSRKNWERSKIHRFCCSARVRVGTAINQSPVTRSSAKDISFSWVDTDHKNIVQDDETFKEVKRQE